MYKMLHRPRAGNHRLEDQVATTNKTKKKIIRQEAHQTHSNELAEDAGNSLSSMDMPQARHHSSDNDVSPALTPGREEQVCAQFVSLLSCG
jgi:hypothetical protein